MSRPIARPAGLAFACMLLGGGCGATPPSRFVENEPVSFDEDLSFEREDCTATIREDTVRAVLASAFDHVTPPCRSRSARHVFGDRLRVRSDGRVDRITYGGCAQEVAHTGECVAQLPLHLLRFPRLPAGECAWVTPPFDLVASSEPVRP